MNSRVSRDGTTSAFALTMRLARLMAALVLVALPIACAPLRGRTITADAAAPGDATDGALGGDGGPTLRRDRSAVLHWEGSVSAIAARRSSDGTALLAAGATDGIPRDFALARLDANLSLQPLATAGTDGFSRVIARLGGLRVEGIPRAVVQDRQRRIVLAGGGLLNGRRSGVIARLLEDGSPDDAFGDRGAVVLDRIAGAPQQIVWRALTTDDDGAVTVAGADTIPYIASSVGLYLRVRDNGSPDPRFGGGEIVRDPRFTSFSALMRDADGYVLAGELATTHAPGLLFLDARGSPRADRGAQGVVRHSAVPGPMVVRAMVRDDDGGIVVAGGAGMGVWTETSLRVLRWDARGAPDLAWGDSGVTHASGLRAFWNFSECLAGGLLPWRDGSFLVGLHEGFGYRVLRVLRDGQIDTSFGTGGSLREDPPLFGYFFGLLSDGADGVWVLYRANMQHDVRATHYGMN